MIEIKLKPLYSVRNYCPQDINLHHSHHLPIRINHTLYYQYSSSQNYYYTKEVNQILQQSRTNSYIQHIDINQYNDNYEYLKRYHYITEFKPKIDILTEFYKYHRDIPRWVIKPDFLTLLTENYDRKRKLEYYRVQRIIQQENQQNPNQPKKEIIGEKPLDSQSSSEKEKEIEICKKLNLLKTILKDITQPLMETTIQGTKETTFQFNLTPSQLLIEKSKQSMDIKQMMNLLNQSDQSNGQEDKNKNKPQNIKINQSLFKNLQQINLKVPQSARYQHVNLQQFEKILGKARKQSDTVSKEKKKAHDKQQQKTTEQKNQLKSVKNEFFKKLRQKQESDLEALEQKFLDGLKDLKTSKQKNQKKKNFENFKQLSPQIQQKEQRNLYSKKPNFLQPHQSINSIMKLCSQQSCNSIKSVSKSNYFSNCTSQNPSPSVNNQVNTRMKKHQIMTLDLKSLLQHHSQKQTEVNSARSEKKSIEDSIKSKEIKTDRESQNKKKNKGLSLGYFKENNYSNEPKNNRKFQSLMQWQIKAMQAVQKEYNLIPKY